MKAKQGILTGDEFSLEIGKFLDSPPKMQRRARRGSACELQVDFIVPRLGCVQTPK